MTSSSKRLAVLATFGLLVAACSGATAQTGTPSPDVVAPIAGPPLCADVPGLVAPADQYRDTPVYAANEMPADELQAWASSQPGFAGLWIDRGHNGWITVAFTQDIDARRADIALLFPDAGVVAVAASHDDAALQAVQERIVAELGSSPLWAGVGVMVDRGVVAIGLGFLTEDALALVQPFEGEPVCIEGAPASEFVAEGPQPVSGDGWRLLAESKTSDVYRTGIATNPDQLAELWESARFTGPLPAVDLGREVVVWLGAVESSSCAIRLDGVVFNLTQDVVHGEFVSPGNGGACTADARSHAFMVAVERERLPDGPFAIQLRADDPPSGVPEERTLVDTDLRGPGSVATGAEIGLDPELLERAGRGYVVEDGGFVEPGFDVMYEFRPECGARVLGILNGIRWVHATGGDATEDIPSAWSAASPAGVIELTIRLSLDPPVLVASAAGVSLEYLPTAAGDAVCPR